MKRAYEKIGNHFIYLDEKYYIAYAGGQRGLSEKDEKEYKKTINLPWQIQRKELKRLGFEKNPNVIPLMGRDLVAFVKELKFVPIFDLYFNQSHLIQLTDIVVYESIRQKSYEIALNN